MNISQKSHQNGVSLNISYSTRMIVLYIMCMRIYIYIYIYLCVCVYLYIYILNIHTYTFVNDNTGFHQSEIVIAVRGRYNLPRYTVNVISCVCICVCMYIYIYIYMYILCIYTIPHSPTTIHQLKHIVTPATRVNA